MQIMLRVFAAEIALVGTTTSRRRAPDVRHATSLKLYSMQGAGSLLVLPANIDGVGSRDGRIFLTGPRVCCCFFVGSCKLNLPPAINSHTKVWLIW